MPRSDLNLASWVIPDAYEIPWPWNDTDDMGKSPEKFVWNKDQTVLTYKHMENDVEILRTWNRSDYKTAYVAKRVAIRQMEVYCRERNLLENEYRKLSKEVLEMAVGDRTTIISGSLVDGLFNHHWKLKQKRENFTVVSRINGVEIELPRFLLRAQPGEIVRHRDGNSLNNTKENLFIQDATSAGEKQRSLGRLNSYPDAFDDEYDYWQTFPPFAIRPPSPEEDYDLTPGANANEPITFSLFGGTKKKGARKVDPNAPPWKQPLCTDYYEWDNTAPRDHDGDSSFSD
jgi:hypothetical protein